MAHLSRALNSRKMWPSRRRDRFSNPHEYDQKGEKDGNKTHEQSLHTHRTLLSPDEAHACHSPGPERTMWTLAIQSSPVLNIADI